MARDVADPDIHLQHGVELFGGAELLAVLAAMQFVVGLWALLLPLAFYASFPYGGTPWVALLPPYNEHLVRDHGAGTLALGVALAFAAWWPERRLVIAVIVAFLVFAVPHAAFHSFHLEHFPLGDAIAGGSSDARAGVPERVASRFVDR